MYQAICSRDASNQGRTRIGLVDGITDGPGSADLRELLAVRGSGTMPALEFTIEEDSLVKLAGHSKKEVCDV